MANGLGYLPKQHAVIRPPIELAMDFNKKSPSEVRQIKRFIRSSLRDALEHGKKKGTFVRDDIGAWFQQTLNYVLLHRNVPREYTETFYGLITPLITSFAFSNAVPKHLWPLDPLGMRRIRAAMHAYMEEFKPMVRKHYGHMIERCDCSPSRSCLEQVTYSFLDTFLQAGGISIPSSIFTGLGVLYSTDPSNPAGIAGFNYKKSEAASVFWEVVRLFTPVRSLPYWGRRPLCAGLTRKQTNALNKPNGKTEACPLSAVDPVTDYPPVNQYKGGYHTLINLATAMNDPAIWGQDANIFRPRPVKYYRKYSVAFAEPAVDNSVANGTMNRDCPARSMALFIGKTFLEIFNKSDWFGSENANQIEIRWWGGPRVHSLLQV